MILQNYLRAQSINQASGSWAEAKAAYRFFQNDSIIAFAIQDKESMWWLESLKKSKDALGLTNVRIVTVCDREADIYDFFEFSDQLQSPVLVRARQDPKINKPSRCSKKQQTLYGCV